MTLLAFITSHPATSAMTAVALGVLLTLLQSVPNRLWRLLVRLTTVQLRIDGASPAFPLFATWLAQHGSARKARTFVLSSDGVAPGFGTHYLWNAGRLLIVRREEDEESSSNSRTWNEFAKESISITAIGTGQRARRHIQELVDTIYGRNKDNSGLEVSVWHFGSWYDIPNRISRPLDSVILPVEQRDAIVSHASWFFENQSWFLQRGVPWRLGFLLSGPPGTGKSSITVALGTHFNRPLCMLSLSSMSNDNELLSAFLQAPKNAIVLIEDVDATSVSVVRQAPDVEDSERPRSDGRKIGVTLSGLLNAIDGVAASEGRLLILTTNHPERLDPALVRKARVDKQFTIGPLTPDLVEEMAALFFPGDEALISAYRSRADLGPDRPAAEWQAEFMDRARDELRSAT